MLAVRPLLFLATFLLIAAPAAALTFDVSGQNFPGGATAEVTLGYDGVDTLTVVIENTSDATALGAAVITGFAFNVPFPLDDAMNVYGVSAFSASGTLDDTGWAAFFPPTGSSPGNAPGGYRFDGGAGTGNNIAGGFPNDGFGIGTTATFSFTFTGAGLAALSEADFLGEFESGAGGPADFGVRFQSIPVGAGSDFALHVPAPGAGALLAPALLALLRRRTG